MDSYKDWTVFLDRDGVINKKPAEHDYIKSWDEFEFLPGAIEAIVILKKMFGRIVVVSNQQGVGKGVIDPFALQTIHQRMTGRIIKAGGDIDLYLHCPHLVSDHCSCRKPEIGMALRAKEIFPEIDFGKSVAIGDAASDVVFGRGIGAFTVLIASSPNLIESSPKEYRDGMFDALFESLYAFAIHPMLFSPNWKRTDL